MRFCSARYNWPVSSANPITEFLNAIERAAARQVDTAPVALATADAEGRPSVRMVLLRGADERGFVFHTNYNSRKAGELAANPHAALCFHWPTLEEQIRVRVESSVCPRPSPTPISSHARGGASLAPGLQSRAWSFPLARHSKNNTGPSNADSKARPYPDRRSGEVSAWCRSASNSGSDVPIASDDR